jgi:hypothetical protein
MTAILRVDIIAAVSRCFGALLAVMVGGYSLVVELSRVCVMESWRPAAR